MISSLNNFNNINIKKDTLYDKLNKDEKYYINFNKNVNKNRNK